MSDFLNWMETPSVKTRTSFEKRKEKHERQKNTEELFLLHIYALLLLLSDDLKHVALVY